MGHVMYRENPLYVPDGAPYQELELCGFSGSCHIRDPHVHTSLSPLMILRGSIDWAIFGNNPQNMETDLGLHVQLTLDGVSGMVSFTDQEDYAALSALFGREANVEVLKQAYDGGSSINDVPLKTHEALLYLVMTDQRVPEGIEALSPFEQDLLTLSPSEMHEE